MSERGPGPGTATMTPPLCASRPAASSGSSPVSPARLSRLQEKEELQRLNDRLAAYIERVRALESDKSALQQRLAELEAENGRELSSLRLCYEAELADARRSLDDVAIERARLQLELSQTSEEHRELNSRNSKAEADLNLVQSHVRDLDAQLNAKEADLATALNEKQRLENNLRELKDHVVTLKSSLEDTEKYLHNEMLKRVDLENHMKNLQEQMTFQKCLHEDELKETKRVHESKIAEIESVQQREFESKLLNALQSLRKEHEEQIQEYKEELVRTFGQKVENAQLSAARNINLANVAREELMETKLRIDNLISEMDRFQSKNAALENRIRELQEMLDYDKDLHRKRMAEKEKEIKEAQEQAQAQLEEYEHLLDVKLALDLEIRTYRQLMEVEEQRLKLSPRLSSHSTASQAASQGQQFLYGRKRKMKEAKTRGHSAGLKNVQYGSSSGSLSIEEIDADGKFVRLRNNSDKDQPLRGWVLRRHLGSVSDVTYKFPSRFTLPAGQEVTIWGSAAGASPGPNDLVWKCQHSWGSGANIDVTLITDAGEELAERRMMHVPRGEESSEEDDVFEEVTGSEMEFPPQQNEDASCSIM